MKKTTNSLAIFESMSDRSLISLCYKLAQYNQRFHKVTGFYSILRARAFRAAEKRGFTF